jgi:hypothetical protein
MGCRLRIPGLLGRDSPITSSKLDQPIFVIVLVAASSLDHSGPGSCRVHIIGVDQGTRWNRGGIGQGNATTIAVIRANVVIIVALPLSASFSKLQLKKYSQPPSS